MPTTHEVIAQMGGIIDMLNARVVELEREREEVRELVLRLAAFGHPPASQLGKKVWLDVAATIDRWLAENDRPRPADPMIHPDEARQKTTELMARMAHA